jgi:hypothetical protein
MVESPGHLVAQWLPPILKRNEGSMAVSGAPGNSAFYMRILSSVHSSRRCRLRIVYLYHTNTNALLLPIRNNLTKFLPVLLPLLDLSQERLVLDREQPFLALVDVRLI